MLSSEISVVNLPIISQVMGDRSGNIRWWDVTTGQSSSFNTHRDGIRRIKFSPFVPGDRSRGRIAVLFYDNTFSVFDLVSMNVFHSCICSLGLQNILFVSKGSCMVLCTLVTK